MKFANLVKDIFLIALIALLAGLLNNRVSSHSISLIREKPESGKPLAGYQNLYYIDLDNAFELFINKKVIFIDARVGTKYQECHISDALSLPYNDFEKKYNQIKGMLNGKKAVVYCDGEGCTLSVKVAQELYKRGHKDIYIFEGGLPQWIAKKYPVFSVVNPNILFPHIPDLSGKSCN